jgi:hypothetical protein
MRSGCICTHLHDHVQQALPPLHVASAHQREGHSRVEVRTRHVGEGVNCKTAGTQARPVRVNSMHHMYTSVHVQELASCCAEQTIVQALLPVQQVAANVCMCCGGGALMRHLSHHWSSTKASPA